MFRAILALVALCAFTTLALAAPAIAPQQDARFEGKVMAVTADSITIMTDRQMDVLTFAVNAQTKVTYNGEQAQLIDIQMGDQATVTGKVMEQDRIATAIVANRRM
ncbi:MAG TPA: hypothetical protein VFV87_14525 [Pirellulaceae bacterium]|nr:hypothetical protein [Pirellulaceae bacterium]